MRKFWCSVCTDVLLHLLCSVPEYLSVVDVH